MPEIAMNSDLDAACLLQFTQEMLEDVPIGLVLATAIGTPVWFNEEAVIVCSVWNFRPQGGDALPLSVTDFSLPVALRTACLRLRQQYLGTGRVPASLAIDDPERGLYAQARLHLPPEGSEPMVSFRLDYRRPRSDRHQELSVSALNLLARLSFREREVAMRVREGLTTPEIARALHRSPLTIKTQLASIFRKLGANSRGRVATLLNR